MLPIPGCEANETAAARKATGNKGSKATSPTPAEQRDIAARGKDSIASLMPQVGRQPDTKKEETKEMVAEPRYGRPTHKKSEISSLLCFFCKGEYL